MHQSGSAWSQEPFADASTRILTMASDAGWTNAAAKILRLAVEQIREGLARWAPTMAAARGDYKVLAPVTTLADVLEIMEFPFADDRRDGGKGPVAKTFHPALQILWLHAITTCIYAEESMVSAMYPRLEYPERPKTPAWTSDKPREKMLSRDQLTELEHWLKRPRKFRKATRDRKYAVTKDVKWPW